MKNIENIINFLGENNRQKLNENGVQLTNKYTFMSILHEIYDMDYNSYYVRGTVSSDFFNVRFNGDMLSYERMNDTILVGGNTLNYGNNATYKIFVSYNNWIDIFIYHENNTYIHFVISPKNNEK